MDVHSETYSFSNTCNPLLAADYLPDVLHYSINIQPLSHHYSSTYNGSFYNNTSFYSH
uniref:Uncharacterized protein n=1 Tax=Octopus bimaculoides TaxID=37653 RepID=A0A0L8GLQ6_OCTBM